jgi:hypothetical protein
MGKAEEMPTGTNYGLYLNPPAKPPPPKLPWWRCIFTCAPDRPLTAAEREEIERDLDWWLIVDPHYHNDDR